jgi:putrescine transport system permease protein
VNTNRGPNLSRAAILALGYGFLYLPIAVLVAYSFNGSRLVTVWGGFSAKWYGVLFENSQFATAALTSFEIAVMAASAALVIGTCAGLRSAVSGGFGDAGCSASC